MTYYEELEVLPTASTEVIKMAYKALARKYHPDIYSGDKKFAERKMAKINEAYSVLSSPIQRQEYDRLLRKMESASQVGGSEQKSSTPEQPKAAQNQNAAQQSESTPKSATSQKSETSQKYDATRQTTATPESSSKRQSSSTQSHGERKQDASSHRKGIHINKAYTVFYVAIGIVLSVFLFFAEEKITIMIGYFCVAECLFFPHWIKSEQRIKDKVIAIGCFITFNIMLLFCFWSIIYSNNLIWDGQHKQNSHIEMNIDTNVVEKSSFLYLINQFDSETSFDDVVKTFGTDYEETDYTGYAMKYYFPKYTLDGENSTFIAFEFNTHKTKILSIRWAYQSPSQSQFKSTLTYLQENALGTPQSASNNKAEWTGLHLEDTGYYLLFIREF